MSVLEVSSSPVNLLKHLHGCNVLTHPTNLYVSQTIYHFTSFTSSGLCCLMSVVYVGGEGGNLGRLPDSMQAAGTRAH